MNLAAYECLARARETEQERPRQAGLGRRGSLRVLLDMRRAQARAR